MTERPTMGAYLRAARRRRRVSIDRAAEDTRIRADFLMRMESDEFDFLAPAYVRGFLKNYARFLRVDPDPLLDEFDLKWGTGRIETAQIVALERRNKQISPKQHRQISNWTIAALFAGAVLVLFAVVGVIAGPEEEEPTRDASVASRDGDERSPTETPTPSPTLTPSPTPTPTPTSAELALAEGFELEIRASRADCWIDVTADGVNVFSGTLLFGDRESFTAEEEMDIVLGYPEGVELFMNGQSIGTPGGLDPVTVNLPDDLETVQ